MYWKNQEFKMHNTHFRILMSTKRFFNFVTLHLSTMRTILPNSISYLYAQMCEVKVSTPGLDTVPLVNIFSLKVKQQKINNEQSFQFLTWGPDINLCGNLLVPSCLIIEISSYHKFNSDNSTSQKKCDRLIVISCSLAQRKSLRFICAYTKTILLYFSL